MAEPVEMARWLQEEPGFSWIPQALASAEPAEQERAGRALAAIEAALRRILAQGTDRGWVRHRGVRYLLLVSEEGGGLCVMTVARSISWLASPEVAPPSAGESPAGALPLPAVRRGPGDYYH